MSVLPSLLTGIIHVLKLDITDFGRRGYFSILNDFIRLAGIHVHILHRTHLHIIHRGMSMARVCRARFTNQWVMASSDSCLPPVLSSWRDKSGYENFPHRYTYRHRGIVRREGNSQQPASHLWNGSHVVEKHQSRVDSNLSIIFFDTRMFS